MPVHCTGPRPTRFEQPFASRGIQAIKEDPDMLDSELSVCLSCSDMFRFLDWRQFVCLKFFFVFYSAG